MELSAIQLIVGTVRFLDAGLISIEQVAALMRPADLSALTGVWDTVERAVGRRLGGGNE